MKPKSMLKTRLPFLAAVATIVFTATPIHAGILFTESFETPDISGYVQGNTPTGWVRAAQGFNSSYHGLIDQEVDGAGGLNFTSPSTQGYAFRYTNSGLTSTAGVIGSLSLGASYTVSVDVVKDVSGATGTPYTIQFLAVAPGAARDDCRSVPTGSTVLATASGNAPGDGSVQTVTFNFSPNAVTHASLFGFDLAVRFIGASDSANVDNVQVSAETPGVVFWDTNGAAAGAGNPATGTWDGSATNWNATADGTGAVASWTPGDKPFFAAGADAIDPYTITVNGSHNIGNLMSFEEGTVTLANGGVGALNLTTDNTANVASGLSATIVPPITEDAAGRQFAKAGTGTLTLAGNNTYTGLTTVAQGALILSGSDNSAATGGMALNGGVTQFESPGSINGTALNVTVNTGATLVFGPTFGSGNIAAALLDRVADASAGTIAADNYATTNFDFATSLKSAAFLGAVGNVNYSGTLTPNGTTYRLGGGGGTLTMANTNALTGANSAIVRGNVALAAANDHSAGTTLNAGGVLTLGNNSSLGSGTFTIAGASTIQASGTVNASNVVSANADFTVAGTGMLTLSGATTINNNRSITNNNTTETTTFASISRDGTNNRNLTINGAGNTTVTGDLVLGTGTLTKNSSGYLTLEGANTYGNTTVAGGRLILKGSNSSTSTTTLTLNQLHLASASNGGLSSGNVTFGNATQFNAVIQAVDADRSITNNLILNNTHGSISGDYSLTVNGTFTNSAGNRTLTNGIGSGKVLTLAGQVNLSNDGTSRSLTITGTGNTIITGVVANGSTSTAGVLVKSGSGTLTLTNNNTYAGTTTVNTGGTLALVGGSQNSAITVNSGAFLGFTLGSTTTSTKALNLNTGHAIRITGTPTLPSYTLIAAASIGGTGTPTLEAPISGYELVIDGTSLKLNSTGGGSPYATWSGGAAFDADANGDGVDNGLAWLLGATDPNANATGLLPTVTQSGGDLVLTFSMLNAASRGTAVLNVQHSSDLGITDPWASVVVPETTSVVGGVDFVVTADGNFNDVIATIPDTEAVGGKLFGRVIATE